MNSEDEARFFEEAREKDEKEEQACLKAEETACLVKDARQEEKDYEHAQLKV